MKLQGFARIRRLGTVVRAAFNHPRADKVRRVLLPCGLAAAFYFFGHVINGYYPIKDWLFLRYARSWLLALYWMTAVMSGGYAVVSRVGPRLPLTEKLVLGCAVGLYVVYLLTFLGGIFGLYRFPETPFLLALLPILIGIQPLLRIVRRAWSMLAVARARAPARPSLARGAVMIFGICYLGLVYLGILHPDNASFDAVYYHLGIAQQNHELGGIFRTPEGWIVDGLPALGAVIYTWGFIVPGSDLFDRMMTCAHLEFVLFCATLLSLPVLVRLLVPRHRVFGAWTALFLFPAILVYDAGLHSANDHIAAFWAVPIWLALRRAWPELAPRHMALFGLCAAGALLTKYQAFSLILAPALALLLRGCWLGIRRRDAPWLQGLGTALAVGLIVTTPHWLKNWIWYGDPLFPALHKYLSLRPFHSEAVETLEQTSRLLQRPKGTFWKQLEQVWRGAFEFPFRTRERRDFHGDWPVFGPLFHSSLAWLPFLRSTKRIWLLLGSTFVGLFFWFWSINFERYLQPLIPWMAAVAAATLVLVWQRGWITKLAAVCVVGLEVVWGADVHFFPHLMLRDSPIRKSAELITSGFQGDLQRRQRIQRPFKDLGEALPPDARVLLHEFQPRIGITAPIVNDYPGFQTLINYAELDSPRAMYDLYTSLGITHIVYHEAYSYWLDNLAGDLRFWEFVTNWATNHRNFGSFMLAEMPKAPPDQPSSNEVAYLSCDPSYTRGLHPISALDRRPGQGGQVAAAVPAPKDKKKVAELVARAGFIVTSSTCKKLRWPPTLFSHFSRVAVRGKEDLWVRKKASPIAQATTSAEAPKVVQSAALAPAAAPQSPRPATPATPATVAPRKHD